MFPISLYGWLAVYCLLILCASLFGGLLPFIGKVTHSRLQFYLSASAGVMLGAAFFHLMPDAMEYSGSFLFGCWLSVGVVGIYGMERFIAPHSHELENGKHEHHHHHHGEREHQHFDDASKLAGGKEPKPAAPAIGGWMAVLGLTIHTFMNGLALAGEVDKGLREQASGQALAHAALPGLAIFLAIALHKPADALAISTVLARKGVKRGFISLVQLGFALMVPVGAIVFLTVSHGLSEGQQGLLKQFTGFALAFSTGTFLLVALSDLLPEVQYHRHDRVPLFACLVAGVLLMAGIARLEDHDEQAPPTAQQKDEPPAVHPHTDQDGH